MLSEGVVDRVKNPIWSPKSGPLYPCRSNLLRSVTLWEEYFLRWTSGGEGSFLMTKLYDLLLSSKKKVTTCTREKRKEDGDDGDDKEV